jgi:hypothetical protein
LQNVRFSVVWDCFVHGVRGFVNDGIPLVWHSCVFTCSRVSWCD